ncbi:MAG: adenine phosphoribosyltransferase [Bacteroidota bacterium]
METQLKAVIREVPDFPIPGINFKDISPIFLDPLLMQDVIRALVNEWQGKGITKVIGIDSRGFLFGPQLAQELGAGFVMVRKKGKLPPETISVSYSLEYGEATLESVVDSIQPGDKVIVHDDLLATGGTARAAALLAQKLGAEVLGFSFLVHLSFLEGEAKVKEASSNIHALVTY